MDQQEIDRLINDIQDYLNRLGKRQQVHDNESAKKGEPDELEAGFFIPAGSRARMERFSKYSRFASYAVEALTIGLFTAGMLAPFSTWPRTLMFLMGVLIFGIFTITVLLSLQARIQLLLRIESNTRNIALNKARIAETLGKIRIE